MIQDRDPGDEDGNVGGQLTLTLALGDSIELYTLARMIEVSSRDILSKIWSWGLTSITINSYVDFDTAKALAQAFDVNVNYSANLCQIQWYSSAICELGTLSCEVKHIL